MVIVVARLALIVLSFFPLIMLEITVVGLVFLILIMGLNQIIVVLV